LEQIQFLLGHVRSRRPNVNLAASSGFDQPSMIVLASAESLSRGRLWECCRPTVKSGKTLSTSNSTWMSPFLHRFRIDVWGDVKGPGRLVGYRKDFPGCSISTIISLLRDRTGFRFSPFPRPDDRSSAAAIERVCLRRVMQRRNQIRSIAIRSEGNEIPCEALRTLHTMANARHKETP
jgi:hypothetical protein